MKNRIILISLIFLIFTGCIGISTTGIFGTGVRIAFDPRSLGTQIDDSVMQKNLIAKLVLREKNSSIILKESDKKNIQKMIKKLSIKDITDLISQNTNVPKKEIYNYCLKLKNEK